MKHTDKIIQTVLLGVVVFFAIVLVVSIAKAEPRIPWDARFQIWTEKDGCHVVTDHRDIAVAFTLMLDGLMTPKAYKETVEQVFLDNPVVGLPIDSVNATSDSIIRACYGSRKNI